MRKNLTVTFKLKERILIAPCFPVMSRRYSPRKLLQDTLFKISFSILKKVIRYLQKLHNIYAPLFDMQCTEVTNSL